MVYKVSFIIVYIIACFSGILSGQTPQWRGPERNGIYSEKGLLEKWPEKGHEMLWSFEGLGAGHGSVGLAKDKIFILGMPDTTGVLYAFDYNGKLLWKKQYGLEWHEN